MKIRIVIPLCRWHIGYSIPIRVGLAADAAGNFWDGRPAPAEYDMWDNEKVVTLEHRERCDYGLCRMYTTLAVRYTEDRPTQLYGEQMRTPASFGYPDDTVRDVLRMACSPDAASGSQCLQCGRPRLDEDHEIAERPYSWREMPEGSIGLNG